MIEEKELEIVLEYEWLVNTIVNRYALYSSREDLKQVGAIALLKAYRHFDPTMGVKFSSFAYFYVKGEVAKYTKEDRNIKVSADMLKLQSVILKAQEKLTQVYLRPPTKQELASFLSLSEDKIDEVNLACEYVQSLDYTISEEGEKELDLYSSVAREEKAYEASLLDLKEALEKLPPLERQLIVSRYFEEKTQAETSELFGISQVQVHRKEKKILAKIKNQLVA